MEPQGRGRGQDRRLSLGLNIPTVKMNEEAHLFADDLLVNYHTAAAVAPQGEAAAESAAEPEAESAPAEEASTEEPRRRSPPTGRRDLRT